MEKGRTELFDDIGCMGEPLTRRMKVIIDVWQVGLSSIYFGMEKEFKYSVWCILTAALLDGLDGESFVHRFLIDIVTRHQDPL